MEPASEALMVGGAEQGEECGSGQEGTGRFCVLATAHPPATVPESQAPKQSPIIGRRFPAHFSLLEGDHL